VQVNYFLEHWTEIKKSETMTQIWTQIRLGKHVGFEEGKSKIEMTLHHEESNPLTYSVWPLIVGQLDFKPS